MSLDLFRDEIIQEQFERMTVGPARELQPERGPLDREIDEDEMYMDVDWGEDTHTAEPLVFREKAIKRPRQEEENPGVKKMKSCSSPTPYSVNEDPATGKPWTFKSYGEHLSRINEFPQAKLLRFEEEGHKYYYKDNLIKNGSVSTIKDLFVPKFSQHRAFKMMFRGKSGAFPQSKNGSGAKSGGEERKRSDILKTWKQKAALGTTGHRKIHEFLNCPRLYSLTKEQQKWLLLNDVDKNAVDPENPKFNLYIALEAFLLTFEHLTNAGYRIFVTEMILHDEEIDVCGSVDAIFRHEKTKDFAVVDWKFTEKHIAAQSSFVSEAYVKNSVTYCYYPFHEYPVSKLNGFAIQVHLYARIFERFYLKHIPDAVSNSVTSLFVAQLDGSLKKPKLKLHTISYISSMVDETILLLRRQWIDLPYLYSLFKQDPEKRALTRENDAKLKVLFPSSPKIPLLEIS